MNSPTKPKWVNPNTLSRTGWPPGLLQDDSPQLSKWLSERGNARQLVNEKVKYMTTENKLTYVDHDGVFREVRGCGLTVDKFDRHWIWCEQLQHNLVYKTKGRENALIAAIDSLLFTVSLRDERIAELQRVVSLAERFAAEAFPDNAEDGA